MVGEVTSPVITEGPHKLAPANITEDGPHKPAPVAPSEPRLTVTEGALGSRPGTPPGTEPDDAGASDADSGTADVLDDLPTPGTPEPEEEEGREEDRHRVVISVTQTSSEVRRGTGSSLPRSVMVAQLG